MKRWIFTDNNHIKVDQIEKKDWNALCMNEGFDGYKTKLEALLNATGTILYQVNLSGFKEKTYSYVHTSKRQYLTVGLDLNDCMYSFARKIVLDISKNWKVFSNAHYYLETGDEFIRKEVRQEALDYFLNEKDFIKKRVAWIINRVSARETEYKINNNDALIVLKNVISVALAVWKKNNYSTYVSAVERYNKWIDGYIEEMKRRVA